MPVPDAIVRWQVGVELELTKTPSAPWVEDIGKNAALTRLPGGSRQAGSEDEIRYEVVLRAFFGSSAENGKAVKKPSETRQPSRQRVHCPEVRPQED